jgi:hypothetical protein
LHKSCSEASHDVGLVMEVNYIYFMICVKSSCSSRFSSSFPHAESFLSLCASENRLGVAIGSRQHGSILHHMSAWIRCSQECCSVCYCAHLPYL